MVHDFLSELHRVQIDTYGAGRKGKDIRDGMGSVV